jgi:thiamine biosynthesis lipoprotein
MCTFAAMNTNFSLHGLAQPECEKVKSIVRFAESAFSRFRMTSQISEINRRGGEWVKTDPLTYMLLEDAVSAFGQTDGIFHPFLGKTLQKLGYDRSFEQLEPPQQPPNTEYGRTGTGMVCPIKTPRPAYLDFDKQKGLVRLSPAVEIDLGGIAKGWIAQHACNQLRLSGVDHGLIDAGGDIVMWGKEPRQGLWGIGVAHPFEQQRDIADLWLEGLAAMATSSIVKRRWKNANNEESVHHIIDPRTQVPARSDLIQATVLARDLTTAEQYAKCLIILGTDAGIPWLRAKGADLAYIAVRKDGKILTSDNLGRYCSELEVHSHL